jgi:hypothetical protein
MPGKIKDDQKRRHDVVTVDARSGSCCQPGLRGYDQCLDPCLQSRMNEWCEARVVVGREIGNCARILSLGIRLGIGAAHKPEDRRYLPLSSKRAKILPGF